MNPEFIKKIKVFSVQLLLVSIATFLLHSYLYSYIGVDTITILPLWQIYVFLTIIVFVLYTWIVYKHTQGNTEVFNYFMIGTIIKMVLAIIFLLPVFLSSLESKKPDVLNFFIPYFIFLAFEVFIITRLLNQKTE